VAGPNKILSRAFPRQTTPPLSSSLPFHMDRKRGTDAAALQGGDGQEAKKGRVSGDVQRADAAASGDESASDGDTGAEPVDKQVRAHVSNIGRSLLYPTLEELALALPMPVKEAQKTEVFREEVNMRAGPPPPPDTPACDAATALPLLLAVLSSQPPPCAGIHRAGRSAEIHQEGQSTKPAAIHQRGRSGL